MKFVHFRNGQRGGATAAFEVEGETIKVGVALCSLKDQFNRNLGRKIAIGRLNNEKTSHRFEVATPVSITKDELIDLVRIAVRTRYKRHFDKMNVEM